MDVHILHAGDFRERVQEFYEDVPCEVFVNPPRRIPKYFEEETHDRRPAAIHMFASGFVMYDPEGKVANLVEQAQRTLATKPDVDQRRLVLNRYMRRQRFKTRMI